MPMEIPSSLLLILAMAQAILNSGCSKVCESLDYSVMWCDLVLAEGH